jgi:hypothetical protein
VEKIRWAEELYEVFFCLKNFKRFSCYTVGFNFKTTAWIEKVPKLINLVHPNLHFSKLFKRRTTFVQMSTSVVFLHLPHKHISDSILQKYLCGLNCSVCMCRNVRIQFLAWDLGSILPSDGSIILIIKVECFIHLQVWIIWCIVL